MPDYNLPRLTPRTAFGRVRVAATAIDALARFRGVRELHIEVIHDCFITDTTLVGRSWTGEDVYIGDAASKRRTVRSCGHA